jgi:hypothetical protein
MSMCCDSPMFKPLNFLSVLIDSLPAILGGIWFQECTLNLRIFFKHLVLQRIAFLGKGLYGTLMWEHFHKLLGKRRQRSSILYSWETVLGMIIWYTSLAEWRQSFELSVLSNEVDISVKESFAVVFLYSEDHQFEGSPFFQSNIFSRIHAEIHWEWHVLWSQISWCAIYPFFDLNFTWVHWDFASC